MSLVPPPGTAPRGLVITVSDRGAAGVAPDRSGPLAVRLLSEHGVRASDPRIVPDDPERVAEVIREAVRDRVDVVVLTGGTGIGPRDRTPEAVRSVLDKELPGVAEAMRAAARARVPEADLSRSIAGTAGETFVLALPGSTGGVRDGLNVAGPLLGHAVAILRGADHPSRGFASPPGAAPAAGLVRCEVTPRALDLAEYEAAVAGPDRGAVVSFAGVVRDHDGGRSVVRLEYEAHPSAPAVLAEIVGKALAEAAASDPPAVGAVAVGHRVGSLGVGEIAFAVAVSAPHRRAAFEACSGLVDEVKLRLPVWKHQVFSDGTTEWVGCP